MTWLEQANQWLAFISPVLTVLVAVGAWLIRRTMATKEDLDNASEKQAQREAAFDARLGAVEMAFTAIRADIEHLPDQDAMDDLRDRIAGIEAKVAAQTASVDGLRAVLERIERPLDLLIRQAMRDDR